MLLSTATLLVLFGTLYPLALDALNMGKISVGPPYFNLVFMLPMLPLLLVVGAGCTPHGALPIPTPGGAS